VFTKLIKSDEGKTQQERSRTMKKDFLKLWSEADGKGPPEYALIVGLIAVACVTAMGLSGTNTLLSSLVSGLSALPH
jgi:Flp pilus assembly pilin Flp